MTTKNMTLDDMLHAFPPGPDKIYIIGKQYAALCNSLNVVPVRTISDNRYYVLSEDGIEEIEE